MFLIVSAVVDSSVWLSQSVCCCQVFVVIIRESFLVRLSSSSFDFCDPIWARQQILINTGIIYFSWNYMNCSADYCALMHKKATHSSLLRKRPFIHKSAPLVKNRVCVIVCQYVKALTILCINSFEYLCMADDEITVRLISSRYRLLFVVS